jgi:hypothetical protein
MTNLPKQIDFPDGMVFAIVRARDSRRNTTCANAWRFASTGNVTALIVAPLLFE